MPEPLPAGSRRAADEPSPVAAAERVHLVGIGGSGMGALATLLLRLGKTVSGSDAGDAPVLQALRAEGASVFQGHDARHLGDAQVVVRSAAVPLDNPEVQAATQRGLPTLKLAEAVGSLARGWEVAAVAGTHGKSTTTALLAWLLERGGVDPKALIGAESVNFGASARMGEGPLVIEADEYDRRFLQLWPEVAIVTSVEADHLDYFSGLEEIQAVFQEFAARLPAGGRLVVCADDPGAMRLTSPAQRETYGFAPEADWRAADYAPRRGGGARFTLHTGGRAWAAESALVGEHNVRNALAALAAAEYFGVGLQSALAALPHFRGTRRRFETKGSPGDVWIVDDYAHHPTAVAANVCAARDALLDPDGDVWAVFQPHTTNRTAALLEEFAAAFDAAAHVLLLPIYRPSGRETAARPVTSEDLAARIHARGHPDVRVVPTFQAATEALRQGVSPGDMVLTMGAGDVTLLADRLVEALAPRT